MRHKVRTYLGIVDLSDDVRALVHQIDIHDRETAKEYRRLRVALAEVRALLGLDADDVPATKEEIRGDDPHGL